ncbi:MAG: DUF2079 domain-containing protein [Myxococcales bacterium]|nr:DUF2079 domain-containing protein [Myxococcales bacterium]MCB9713640.1 DUF2079 domain-containing protein [Myxococcales bacterium]
MTAPEDAPPPEPSDAIARPLWLRILRLEFLDGIIGTFQRWLLGALIIGVGPGLALWAPLHREDPKFVLDDIGNHLIKVDLSLGDRIQMIEWGLWSLLAMGLLYAGLGLWHRRRGDGRSLPEVYARLNLQLVPVGLLPVFSALWTEQLEARLHLLSLTLIAVSSAIMGAWYYHMLSARVVSWRERLAPLERRAVPELLMTLLVLGYAWTFGYLSVTDHHNLGTHIYDLALYDNTFWNTAHGDSMACSYLRGGTHYSAHYDPIIILLAPIYGLAPRAETLLWLQSVWLAMGGVPLYLIAKRVLGNPWQALVVMLLFYLAPALHGINMFDFHSLALMVPLVMWMIYLLDVGTPAALVGYWIMLGLLLLTREDMPFVACSISIYAIATRRRVTGVMTILVAIAYLIEIKSSSRALLSGDKESYSYSYYYEEMIPKGKDGTDEGLVGLVTTALSDPVAAMAVLLKPPKLVYFGKVLMPLLLLPFFSGRKVLLLAYGMLFIGLVSRKYVFSVHFQYSAVLLPFLLMAWPDGLNNVSNSRLVTRLGLDPRRLRNALVLTALLATALVSAKFGAIVPNREFHAGWNELKRTHDGERAERYQEMLAFIEKIPADASVCTNSTIGPHVSNRPVAVKWPSCRAAEYVMMTNDDLKKKDRRRLDRMVSRGDTEVIAESDAFILLRQLPKEERDALRKQKAAERRSSRKSSPRTRPRPRDDEADEADEADDDENPYHDADRDEDEPAAKPSPPDRGRNDEE